MITPSFGLTATERVLPKLALDFTTASLDPRVTFTRSGATATCVASSGYIVDVAADTPRFDYNPITLVCKGLLIEESRTNLILQSADFGTSWTLANITLATNDTNSPANTLTADKMTATAATAVFSQIMAKGASAITYTASIFVKGDSTAFSISLDDTTTTNRGRVSLDLTTGTLGTAAVDGNFTNPSATVTQYANGFYRLTLTVTSNTVAALRMRPFFTTTSNVVYVWGAQVEAGAFATSYIPTTSAALTRNADVATMTGTNFSDFWQASKGGAQVQAIPSTVSGIRPLVQYDDGTADNIIALRGNAINPELQIIDGGAPQVQLDAGTIAANTTYSLTGWWQPNDCKARKDSGAVVTDDTATIPTVTQARIGSDGTNYLNGTIATINYYAAFSSQIYTRRKNKVIFNLM